MHFYYLLLLPILCLLMLNLPRSISTFFLFRAFRGPQLALSVSFVSFVVHVHSFLVKSVSINCCNILVCYTYFFYFLRSYLLVQRLSIYYLHDCFSTTVMTCRYQGAYVIDSATEHICP